MPSRTGSTPADTAADRPVAVVPPRPSPALSRQRLVAAMLGALALTGLVFAASHLAGHWRLGPLLALALAIGCALLWAWAWPAMLAPAATAGGATLPQPGAAAAALAADPGAPTVLLQRVGERWQIVDANPAAQATGLPAAGTAAADWLAGTDPALRAHSAAQADMAETESFAYTVSHDLRAPIRVIEGFTRIVREDYGQVLDRIGNDHLDRVLGAAARMNSMIDAMLALARLSSQPLARQRVDLSRAAQYVLDDLQKHTPQRRVETRVMPGLEVEGDPTLLRLVLENLLGNAFKYSSRRDIAHIEFGAEPKNGTRVYYVSDDGAGFDMRFADRLFGAFQRLHSASEFQGTGVGLASVRRIVRRHGGEIWAEAEVDKGATFYFTLG
jgi:signal transduction histidine kinase